MCVRKRKAKHVRYEKAEIIPIGKHSKVEISGLKRVHQKKTAIFCVLKNVICKTL